MCACPDNPESTQKVPAGLLDSLREGGNTPYVRDEEVERVRTAVDRRPLDNEVATTIATRLLELSLIG